MIKNLNEFGEIGNLLLQMRKLNVEMRDCKTKPTLLNKFKEIQQVEKQIIDLVNKNES